MLEYKRAKPNPCVRCEVWVSGHRCVCIHSAILVTFRTILPKLALDSMYSCAACACSSVRVWVKVRIRVWVRVSVWVETRKSKG